MEVDMFECDRPEETASAGTTAYEVLVASVPPNDETQKLRRKVRDGSICHLDGLSRGGRRRSIDEVVMVVADRMLCVYSRPHLILNR